MKDVLQTGLLAAGGAAMAFGYWRTACCVFAVAFFL